MELILPSAEYKDSFIEAVKEFRADAKDVTTRRYRELSTSELKANFEAFVQKELSHARGEDMPEGYVPQSEFWLVEGGEYIGHVGVRHTLNEHLLNVGGHIGYSIRPSKRGRGYGNKILELALKKTKELGISRTLITCDVTNIPSRKIIENNGGVLENQVSNLETGTDKLRFWIDIK